MPQFDAERQLNLHLDAERAPDLGYLNTIDAFNGDAIYDPQSPATQYILDRVKILCGDEYDIPSTYLVDRQEINASASDKTVIANAGIFNTLETQEELDALLAHEIGHVVRGHTCRAPTSNDTLERIGMIRAGESEADLFAMNLLDRRGINPLGAIRLLETLEKSADGASGKRSTYASPTHGDTMERRITLEQALHVIDAKHLSPDLTPLAKPDLGQTVCLDTEGFASLIPAAQQAVLSTAWQDKAQRKKCLDLQAALVASLDSSVDPEHLEVAAQAILQARADSKSMVEPSQGLAECTTDLYIRLGLLNAPSAKCLIPEELRTKYKQQQAARVVHAAIVDSETTATQVADFVTALDTTYQVRLDLKDVIRRNSEPYTANTIAKTASAVAATRDPAPSLFLPDTCHTEGVLELLTTADKMVTHGLESQLNVIEKLRYITRYDDDYFNGHLAWGHPYKSLPDAKGYENTVLYARTGPRDERGEQIVGPVAQRLHYEVSRLVPATLIDAITAQATVEGSAEEMQKVAMLAFTIYTRDYDFDDLDIQPKELLKFALLTNDEDRLRNYIRTGNWSGSVGDFVDDDDIASNTSDQQLRVAAAKVLRHLSDMQKARDSLARTLPADVILPDVEKIAYDTDAVRTAKFYRALQGIVGNKAENGVPLRELVARDVIPVVATNELITTQGNLDELTRLWQKAAECTLAKPDLMHDEDALLTLAALGMSAGDLELKLALPSAAFRQIARLRSFEDGIKLFEEFPNNVSLHLDILGVLIEEKAVTAEDFEALNAVAEGIYIKALSSNLQTVGTASVLDSLVIPFYSTVKETVRTVGLKVDTVKGLESSKLLAGMLSSGEDDSLLKEYMAERWWLERRTGTYSEGYDNTVKPYFVPEEYIIYRGIASKTPRLAHWLKHEYPQSGSYEPFDDSLGKLYLATAAARFIAVRKLLLAPGDGILMGGTGRTDLVDALMTSWLAIENDEEREITRDLLLDLITDNKATDTYQHIGPMLQDMILKVPKHPTDLRDTTLYISNGIIQNLVAQNKLKDPNADDRRLMHYKVHKLFTGLLGAKNEAEPYDLTLKNRLLAALDVLDAGSTGNKFSAIGFAALVGKKSGSLGVKMLQLAGQYFDLEAEDKEAFEGVYDDMVGQTRLQAYNTLKREAAYDPATAELLEGIQSFGLRIGGGSLFTVYKVYMRDGREVAIGIKNPNADYRVTKLASFATTGLNATVLKHQDSTTLRLMSSLLEDAATWVQSELEDADASHKDAVFAAENSTDRTNANGFDKGNARYELLTPEILPNNSPWIRAETFVSGKNLTGLTVVNDQPTSIPNGIIHTDDFKQVTSLLTRNYVHQIMQGSYAHSDIHPGNFRVTTDNTAVAVFDRHNLIPMNPELRRTVMSAFEAVVADDLPRAMREIALYSNEGHEPDSELLSALEAIAADTTSDAPKMIAKGIVAFKKAGLSIPLDLSLILRNFMSIAQLSTQAGFSGLAEAFLHTAGPDDLKKFGL